MNALNIADTASRPLCSFCGMSLPDNASGIVVCGDRLNASVADAGPMLTFWKKFWNPIDVSSTPTCEGYKSG